MKKSLILAGILSALVACEKQTSDEHLAKAKLALNDNQYNAAVIELKNAAQLSPNDAQVRFLLGKTYLEFGQLPQAEKELERALEGGYDASEVIPLLSKVYQRTGESKALFKLSAKAKGLKPRDLAQLKLYQLQSYVSAGNDEKANALIEGLKQIQQGGEYSQLTLAYDFIIKQQLDNALTQLEQILTQYPNQADTLKLKAQLQLNTQQPEKAVETYQAYLDADPDDVDIKFLLARLYSDLRQPAKAEPILDELLVDYPQQPLLLQLKASARAGLQDHKGAYEFAEQAVVVNPEDVSSRLIAGVSAYFLQDSENTNRHLSLIATVLPSTHLALRFLADAQVKLGLTLDANDTVQRFEQLTEQDAGLLSDVGLALLRAGDHNKAHEILEKQPQVIEEPAIQASVAMLKLSLNDVSGILDLESALKGMQGEGDAPANLNLMQLEATLVQAHFSNGQFDKVLEIAARWQQANELSTQVKGFVIEAKAHERQNNKPLAKAAYKQALKLEPNSPGLALALIPFEHETLSEQLKAIDTLLAQHPQNLPIVLKHYLTTKLLKQPEQMTAHLAQQLKLQPDNTALKVTLAKMWLLEAQPQKAITLFEDVKQSLGNVPSGYWGQLATAYIQTKRYDDAVRLYKAWFELQPNHPEAVVGRIKALHVQGESQKALEVAEQYLNEVRDNHLEVQLLRLYLLSQVGQFEQLARYVDSLSDSLQTLPLIQGLKGQVLFTQGKASEALSGLQIAYQATPSPSNTQWVYRALSKSKGPQVALVFLETHVSEQPNDAVSLLALAQIITNSNPSKAQSLYQQLIKLNSNNFIAHNNLANLLSRDGNYQQAYQHALKGFELQPNEGLVLDTLGGIELKLNKNKEALAHMQAAVGILKDGMDDQVMLNYLEALYRNQQHALANRKAAQYTFVTEQGKARYEQIKQQYQ